MIGTSLYFSPGFAIDELREWAAKGDAAAQLTLDMLAQQERAGWIEPLPAQGAKIEASPEESAFDAEVRRQVAELARARESAKP